MMNILLDLFLTFAKIGLFTFGGGYAMIGIFENVCVETKKWISHDDMMNITVIAESTPGPIAINCATFIGYKQAGVIGSVIATLGVVLPSFIVIFLISMCLDNFMELTLVANAFKGIKVGVGIIIVNAAVNMIKKMNSKKKKFPKFVMVISFGIMMLINIFSWNFSTISLLLATGTISLGIFIIKEIGVSGGKRK